MNRAVDRSRTPVLAAPVEARLPPFTRHRLSNGLEVAIAELHTLPVVAVRLTVRAGAAVDPPRLAGRASLTADVLDEGTASRSGLEIAGALEMLGADLVVDADWDETTIAVQVLSSRLGPTLELLADVVAQAAFRAEDFAREKQERLTALLQEQDEPAIVAAREFAAQVYSRDHPYGNAPTGDLHSIERLAQETLVQFHRELYRPGHAFVVVVGDITPTRLVPTLERVFESWAGEPVVPASPPAEPVRRPTSIRVVDRPAAPLSELRIGHAGPSRTTEHYFPLVVLNTILGGSFTSRLNTRLREEKGYTYGVRSSFSFRKGPGPFAVSTAVDTRVTGEAVADVLREIARLREETVTESELERARNYLALGLPRRFETVHGIALHIVDVLLHGLPHDYYDHYMANVRDVSAAAVRDAAQRYLDPQRSAIVIAGDYEAIAAPLEGLGVGRLARIPAGEPVGDTGTPLAGAPTTRTCERRDPDSV